MTTHDHVSQDCGVCAGELQKKLDVALRLNEDLLKRMEIIATATDEFCNALEKADKSPETAKTVAYWREQFAQFKQYLKATEKRNCECAKASCPQCGPSGDDEGRIIPGQQITVNVNGKLCNVGNTLTYEEILKLARQSEGASVLCTPEDRRLAGFSVIKGQAVEVSDGMVIVCMMTGNA